MTATKKRAARPALLAKALESAHMSTATEDLLTSSPAWQPGETSALQHIPIDIIFPAVDNPRSNLGDLTGLAASIAAVGILEPILVQVSSDPVGDRRRAGAKQEGYTPGYTIVAGHRRHAAAKVAGLELIPCLVRVFTEQARIEAMVIENLQRQDLSPFDEARGLKQLVNVGLTQRDIAERVGCSQSHVSKRLSLAALPPAAEKLFTDSRLSVRHVEELAKVPEADATAVVEQLVKHANRAAGTLLPDWAISNEIDGLKRLRKHREAEKEGEASGLKRLTDRPYQGFGKHRFCKKADATHWFVGNSDTTVIWARTEAAELKANPPKPETARPKNEWELQREARERIDKFVSDAIFPAANATKETQWTFTKLVTKLVFDDLHRADRYDGIEAVPLSEDLSNAIGDDRGMYVAVALLTGLIDDVWQPEVLEFFVGYGYRTTGAGETFPEGFDPTPILITDAVES